MILAGDIGGTKTLIGVFDPAPRRPIPRAIRAYPTTGHPSLVAIIETFLAEERPAGPIASAAFGVAGPVIDQSAQMTNVEWRVDAAELVRRFGFSAVRLLNDLEAMAYAVPVLEGVELHTLQTGEWRPEGNMAIIAAGTGLGGSMLHRVDGRYVPVPSEIGHSDFPARTDRELEFVRFARSRFDRAEVEHVLSGPGLVNLWQFTHQHGPCAAISATPEAALPAEISRAALEHACERCRQALDMFVDAYGAVAGNLALTAVTTGGIFVGGGIAPRILPALTPGRFVQAFNDKGPMRGLLERIPVHVILNADAGLLGAAVYANQARL